MAHKTHTQPTTFQELEDNLKGSPLFGVFEYAHHPAPACDAHVMFAREVIRTAGPLVASIMPWPEMRAALVDAEARAPLRRASWEG